MKPQDVNPRNMSREVMEIMQGVNHKVNAFMIPAHEVSAIIIEAMDAAAAFTEAEYEKWHSDEVIGKRTANYKAWLEKADELEKLR